ncbi:MAG: ABC transporter ATP-binding protein [Spirochaetales bacterium]|nr:ABC transporter ATP-binding protein [Spirochaetales bacterium]
MKKKNWIRVVLDFAANCRGKMIVSVICAVISVFGGIVPYFAVYNIIKLFIEGDPTTSNIVFWGLIALAGYAVKQLFFLVSTMLSHISAYTILENIRKRMADRLMRAPLGTVLNDTAGRIKNTIVDKVEEIELPLAHAIPEVFSHMLLPIAVFVYLCLIDWRMALVTLVTIPVAAISISILMRGFSEKYNKYMKSSDHVNSVIVEYIEGIEVIRAFNQSASSYEKFSYSVRSFLDFSLEWFRSTWPVMNFSLAVLPSSLLGTVPLGIHLYSTGSLSVAEFAISIILSLGIVAPLMKLQMIVNDIKAIDYAVMTADDFLNLEPIPDTDVNASISGCGIKFNDVSFSYSNNLKVLDGMNLEIVDGSFTALVGPSGGGKSTVARLIARFWDINSGSIEIGGVNIKDMPLSQLMQLTSYVTQDNFLFDCSLKENIRMGRPEASDSEVFEAAQAAQCDDFISKLDLGYDTPAGEAGRRLSGGEKQRIAIARAILKNAPIVLLDEATAFTDPENEEKIQKSIMALTRGKTLLVIAHRLSTIRNADKIILIDNGKAVQSGTHEQLIEKSSLYSSMWKAHVNARQWVAGSVKGEINV